MPEFEPLPDELELPVLLKVGDNVSTDEILPAGARVLPFRSNIPTISRFAFDVIDPTYPDRAAKSASAGGQPWSGGSNYGQGSSREHAALAPRYLGLRVVIAKSFARIHWQNLVNFGILPLCFHEAAQYESVQKGDVLRFRNVGRQLRGGRQVRVDNVTQGTSFTAGHELSKRQVDILLTGGMINWVRGKLAARKDQRGP